MSFNKRFFPVGGIVASSQAACLTETTDIFGDSSGVALYSLDYDASDESGTYDGSPTNVDFGVGGQINYGARFNGNTSFIQTNNPGISGAQNRTVAFWVKYTSTGQAGFYSLTDTAASEQLWVIRQQTAGTIRLDTNNSYRDWALTLNDDNWYHIAVVQNGNRVTGLTLYLDGVAQTPSNTGDNDVLNTSTGNASIGKDWGAFGYLDGVMDQVRIFSKALSSDEVDTLYAETACVYTSTTDTVNYPTGTTPIAYYKLDNSSEDYSTGGNDGTDTNIEYRFGRFGQAAVFNGSSSAIVVEDSSSNTFGFANHTGSISAWVNIDSLSSENNILAKRDSGNPGNRQWYLRVLTSGAVEFELFNTDSNTDDVISTTTLNTNQWYHIVATLTTSNLKIYINGVEDASESSTYSTIQNAGADLEIGRRGKNSGYGYFDGSIDQIRIYDTALTSDQVTELYNEKPEVDTSNFKAVLYEGTGATQYISNIGFQPDLVWIKNRDQADSHRIHDSMRGVFYLESDTTSNEINGGTAALKTFESNGFTIGTGNSYNTNNESYIAWVWKGGGDAVSNTDGSITSQVSANTDAGFSIVKFTSPSSGVATIGTGLNQQAELVIGKVTNTAANWPVFVEGFDTTDYLLLNTTTAKVNHSSDLWNLSNWSSSLIGCHRDMFGTSNSVIAYCFHSVAGYSKIGSYSGTSAANNRIYTTDDGSSTGSGGFEPSWLMIKRTTGAGWYIIDNKRSLASDKKDYLQPNDDGIEGSSSTGITFNSDGFTFNGASFNFSPDTHIYMAFK